MINSNLVALEESKKDTSVLMHRGVLLTSVARVSLSVQTLVNEDILLMPIKFTSAIRAIGIFGEGVGTNGAVLSFGIMSKDKKTLISPYGTIVQNAPAEVAAAEYASVVNLLIKRPDVTLYQQMCTLQVVEGKQRYVETPVFAPYRGDDFGYLAMRSGNVIPITRIYSVRVQYVEQLSQARNTEQV